MISHQRRQALRTATEIDSRRKIESFVQMLVECHNIATGVRDRRPRVPRPTARQRTPHARSSIVGVASDGAQGARGRQLLRARQLRTRTVAHRVGADSERKASCERPLTLPTARTDGRKQALPAASEQTRSSRRRIGCSAARASTHAGEHARGARSPAPPPAASAQSASAERRAARTLSLRDARRKRASTAYCGRVGVQPSATGKRQCEASRAPERPLRAPVLLPADRPLRALFRRPRMM